MDSPSPPTRPGSAHNCRRQHSTSGPVVLPALSLPLSPSNCTSTEGTQPGLDCSHHLPPQHPQRSTSRETTLWENPCTRRREKKPPGVLSSCIHPLRGESGCVEQGSQQRVSSTPSLLCGSEVTGVGMCSSKGLLISCLVRHKGETLPQGKVTAEASLVAREEATGETVLSTGAAGLGPSTRSLLV